MKQLIKKISDHGKRGVHFGITLPVITLVIFSLVDIPLFTMAQELKMETPIVHIYKVPVVAQATTAMPPVVNTPASEMTNTTTSTAPATGESTAAPAPVVEPAPTTTTQPATTIQPVQPVDEGQTIKPIDEGQAIKPVQEQQKVNESTPMNNQVAPDQAPQQNIAQPMPIEQPAEKEEMEFVDPREVQNALRDIKRMQKDLRRFIKQLKRVKNSADDIAAINELLAQLANHQKNISNPPTDMSLREALQDFWDARLWEEVDQFRAKAEIPGELKNIEKDLRRLKKLITQKPFKNLGFDMALIGKAVAEIEASLNEMKTFYNQGNMEEALLALDNIRNMHPGEMMGVLYQTREIKDKIRLIKNKEVKEIIDELLATVIESFNSGDYREANHVLNEIRQELLKIIGQFRQKPRALDEKTRAKLDALEEKIGNKLNREEEPNQKK